MEKHLFYIERDTKWGGFDFGVNTEVALLPHEEYSKLREMLVVGIGTMESMWRRAQESKHPASEARPQ